MSLRDAIAGDKTYSREFAPYVIYLTLRRPTSEEALQFRQKLTRYRVENGIAKQTNEAANASLWYFEKLLVKKEYSNGSGPERLALPEEDYKELPDDCKLAILEEHLGAIRGASVDLQKN